MMMDNVSMTANSGWLCYPGNPDRGGDPVIHEMVHTINHIVFEDINEVYSTSEYTIWPYLPLRKVYSRPSNRTYPKGNNRI